MTMKLRSLRCTLQQEDLNFLLTNRVPRIALTRLMGRFARIESPWLARLSIAIWQLFTDLDLSESPPRRYRSVRECFTRELLPGSRPIDARPSIVVSPCDGIVGQCGGVVEGMVYQAKGFPYSLAELFGPSQDVSAFVDGVYVTIRLTSAMYHRFHAPHDLCIDHVTYLSGDTWNVNPVALARVERLFCRNERAVLRARLRETDHPIAIVPVAAVLVASMRLHCVDGLLHLDRRGPNEMPCAVETAKGEELGWFEHGSTILVFAPSAFALASEIKPGHRITMGMALMTLSRDDDSASSAGHLDADRA